MTAGKHTPAPWMAATSASSVVGWPVVSQQGKPVCDVMGVPDNFPNAEKHNEEALANAILIAAAPEMLKELECQVQCNYNPFEPDNQSENYKRLVAIVKKAKGYES